MTTATTMKMSPEYNFISFVLLCDYFNLLNFYRNGELSRSQIGRSGIQVKKENEKIHCHVLTFSNLVMSLFAEESKEMYQNVKRTCRAIVFAH